MKTKYWILLVISLFVLVSDQWTKHALQESLALYERVKVIPGFFNITHVRNTGGAFGIFGGEKEGFLSLIFISVSLIAIGFILFFFFKMKENEKILPISFSLVLGGAIGNLIDRIQYGEVVDFLDFYLYSYHWPAFNIADSAICIGIGLMGFELLIREPGKSSKPKAPTPK